MARKWRKANACPGILCMRHHLCHMIGTAPGAKQIVVNLGRAASRHPRVLRVPSPVPGARGGGTPPPRVRPLVDGPSCFWTRLTGCYMASAQKANLPRMRLSATVLYDYPGLMATKIGANLRESRPGPARLPRKRFPRCSGYQDRRTGRPGRGCRNLCRIRRVGRTGSVAGRARVPLAKPHPPRPGKGSARENRRLDGSRRGKRRGEPPERECRRPTA